MDGAATVFDSNAILLYLAEKTGRFLPEDTPAERVRAMLSWLMFVASGVGPFSGQSVHFRHYAPEPNVYAKNRYSVEARRHYGILDDRLARQPFMLGDAYTLVDMAVWGWARLVPFVLGSTKVFAELPHLKRLVDAVGERPAAATRGRAARQVQVQDRDRRRGAALPVPAKRIAAGLNGPW